MDALALKSSQSLIFVCATRADVTEFAVTPTGQSLSRVRFGAQVRLALAPNNKVGLSTIYNRVITPSFRDAVLVFVHDDIWIDDVYFVQHLLDGLSQFDVVGLAGNRRCLPEAPSWAFKNDQMAWDSGHLSGVVCHGPRPFGTPSLYGPAPAQVALLDGVLLAARCSTLLDAGVRFDERFDFHFYDLDFCRSAGAAGLRLGTITSGVTHVSGGSFGSPSWRQGLQRYRQKWPVTAMAEPLYQAA